MIPQRNGICLVFRGCFKGNHPHSPGGLVIEQRFVRGHGTAGTAGRPFGYPYAIFAAAGSRNGWGKLTLALPRTAIDIVEHERVKLAR